MNRLTKLGLIALIAVTAAGTGCTKKPKSITPIPGGMSNSGAPGGGLGSGSQIRDTSGPKFGGATNPGFQELPGGKGVGKDDPSALPSGDPRAGKDEDRETFKANTVYFEYDKSAIQAAEAGKIGPVIEFLKSHADNNLLIEGHCDERGTEEYNRALGERRALALRERVTAAGISGERVTTISYGEDRPADPGHDAAAWSKNRRGEFILLVPSKGGALK
jgi:peptidoglycan-associated lipoprotein